LNTIVSPLFRVIILHHLDYILIAVFVIFKIASGIKVTFVPFLLVVSITPLPASNYQLKIRRLSVITN
jgi:hypothetical protein